ncbi:uncharacterized protein [Aegilops tauschii subsp. strangulata]|uniref:uncharacterized protein n=1 Tax=Aegilops tauschii subsp. strangulata TaxID=200361 RepID=UPI000989CF6C|nr:uncharacterized protein LOC109755819 isoform X2 [Aegilops tauschii subsp. strangulata]
MADRCRAVGAAGSTVAAGACRTAPLEVNAAARSTGGGAAARCRAAGASRLLDEERQGRLELAERRRRRLELVDRRANLSNSSKEHATRCPVWLGDLIDAKKLGGSAAGSDMLHLPVAGVATAGPKTQCTTLMYM